MVSFSFLVTRSHTITPYCHASRLSSFASHYVSANIHPFTAINFEGLVIIHDRGVGARRVEGGGGGITWLSEGADRDQSKGESVEN